ncbi:MAG: hypothetical protein R2828_10215 [Saprospiraceae bacterium]
MNGEVSSLIKDLSSVSSIVGSLGLSIAAAQKAFNLDYLENLEKLLASAKSLLGQESLENDAKLQEFNALITNMIISLAPSRYQFTETTLTVKLDLAQTMSKGTHVGLGMNVGAVAVNAAMTSAFGYDYRAAAEVKTVLHAIPPDIVALKALLGQARAISKKALELPSAATVDANIIKTSSRIFEKVVEKPAAEIKPTKPAPPEV